MAGLDDGSPPPTDGTRRWGRLLAACVAALALLLGAGLGTARAADGGSTTATAAEPATAAASGSAPATESTTTTQSTTTQEATAAEPAKTTEPAPSAPTQAAPTEAAPTEAAPTEAAPSQPTPTEPVPPAAAAPAPAKPPEASPPPEPAAPPTPPAPTPQPPAQPIVLLVVPAAAPPQPAPPPPAPTDPPPAPPVAPPIGAGAAAEVIHAEFEVAATLAGPTLPNELTWIAPAVAVPTAASSVVVVDSQPVRGAPGAQLETGAHGRLASAEAPREPAMHRDVRKSAPHRPAPRSTDDHAPLPPVPTHPAGAGAGSAPDGGGGGVTSAVGARTSDPVPTLVLVLHHAAKTPHSSQALGLRIERPG